MGSAGGCSRWDTSLEVVGDYQAAQKTLDPSLPPGFIALEGYLSGRLAAVAVIQKDGPCRAVDKL